MHLQVAELPSVLSPYVHIVYLATDRPAHLPFHLLTWGQQFIKRTNCELFERFKNNSDDETLSPAYLNHTNKNRYSFSDTMTNDSSQYYNTRIHFTNLKNSYNNSNHKISNIYINNFNMSYDSKTTTVLEDMSLFEICHSDIKHIESIQVVEEISAISNISIPIKYIYYTESDQIVHFDDWDTLTALSTASNSTTFFTGRRKTKDRDSDPKTYMSDLNSWRDCCTFGYALYWPNSSYVRNTLTGVAVEEAWWDNARVRPEHTHHKNRTHSYRDRAEHHREGIGKRGKASSGIHANRLLSALYNIF